MVDPFPDRLGSELRDRVTRIDALGAALVAEIAPGAVPDPVLVIQLVEALDRIEFSEQAGVKPPPTEG